LISFGFGRHAIVTGTDRSISFVLERFRPLQTMADRPFGVFENIAQIEPLEVCLGETEAREQSRADEEPTN
jgi:hypothetical protein